jgi:hypothetical protein
MLSSAAVDADHNRQLVDDTWSSSIVSTLEQYIRIPNQSPLFDPDWKRNGHMNQAVSLAKSWVESQGVKGLTIEVHELEGRTPVIFMEIEGDASGTVLMYGHLDKQPAMVGWEEGLGPWTPVLRDGKLYGRGGADDGYAIFATIASIRSRAAAGSPARAHRRAHRMLRGERLPRSAGLHRSALRSHRHAGLVICLDSGCGNYEQLWMTTSLRGSIVGNLTSKC